MYITIHGPMVKLYLLVSNSQWINNRNTERQWWISVTLLFLVRHDGVPKHISGFSFSVGLLGPTLRAEEGETIVVSFRNMATGPHSIHPHGVAYGKQSEGGCLLTQLQMNLTAVANLKAPVTLYNAVCLFGSLWVLMMLHKIGQHNKQPCLSFSNILTRTGRLSK